MDAWMEWCTWKTSLVVVMRCGVVVKLPEGSHRAIIISEDGWRDGGLAIFGAMKGSDGNVGMHNGFGLALGWNDIHSGLGLLGDGNSSMRIDAEGAGESVLFPASWRKGVV